MPWVKSNLALNCYVSDRLQSYLLLPSKEKKGSRLCRSSHYALGGATSLMLVRTYGGVRGPRETNLCAGPAQEWPPYPHAKIFPEGVFRRFRSLSVESWLVASTPSLEAREH